MQVLKSNLFMLLPRLLIGIFISLFSGWAAAQTLNLGQLIQLAIESHPSVQAQLSNEKSAQSGIETAEYQRYPTPQLSYESVKKDSAGDNMFMLPFGHNIADGWRIDGPPQTVSDGSDGAGNALRHLRLILPAAVCR